MFTLIKELDNYFITDGTNKYSFTKESIADLSRIGENIDDYLGELRDIDFDTHNGKVTSFYTVICPYDSDINGATCTTCNCDDNQQEECGRNI